MNQATRRIFFYSSILIFILAAPLIVAYSLGYIFDPISVSLEKTGGIFIKSKTPRISIFVDGVFIKETSFLSGGALLTDISLGTHRLRLEKSAHHSWSKTIVVEPSLVTDFRNVLLLPIQPLIATSTKEEIANLKASTPGGSFRSIAPKETISAPNLPTPSPSPAFFLDKKQNLIAKTATTSTLFLAHVNSFNVLDGIIYFIDKNGFLGKIDPISKNITTIGRPGFYLSDTPAQLSKTRDDQIIILDASGGLFLSDGSTYIRTITGGVRQFAFDSSGKKMLLKKDQSVDILWLENNTFQPFQPKETREQVFASEEIIQDVDWFFGDDAHIVMRMSNGIFFTDIDPRDGKNVIQLFERKTDELITTPDIPQSIFFRRGKTFYTILL